MATGRDNPQNYVVVMREVRFGLSSVPNYIMLIFRWLRQNNHKLTSLIILDSICVYRFVSLVKSTDLI